MSRSRPPIKNGVDLQLQSACSEGNWLVVLRLAEKRIRTSKDPYYETLKICAESQLDDTTTRFAAIAAVWQYVKDGTVIKDVDALDLLEWACQDHLSAADFSGTLGTLRARAVKAGLKSKTEAIRCIEACLLHWDLVNAQQIAATMDRTYPHERMFMFWNIAITHMLSTNAQSPPEKKKLYGMLAQKQIERAAQASKNDDEGTAEATKSTARTVQSEDEILLLYDVVEKHGTPDDLTKLLCSQSFGPVPQFRKGRKELLIRTLHKHRQSHDWRAMFDLCRQCLMSDDTDRAEPNYLAADWSGWQDFIEAASHLESVDPTAGQTVQTMLLRFAESSSIRPIYRRNILLARLAAVFAFSKADCTDAQDEQPASLRLKELIAYLQDQVRNSACFNDVKGFMEKLDESGLQWLASSLHAQLRLCSDSGHDAESIDLLCLKVRYFVSTCGLVDVQLSPEGVQKTCRICRTGVTTAICHCCLKTVTSDSLRRYQELRNTTQTRKSGILAELAILAALCYINSAEISPSSQTLSNEGVKALHRALVVLEEQLNESPKHSVILLLLVQLHLRIGSAYRARILWDDLGVKRTIVDCVAPILYDRLSTIAPSLLSRSEKRGYELAECISSHYEVSLKHPMPRRLIDAFEAGSYSSILKIPDYIENLRSGCTRVMSLVEEARSARLLDGPGGRLLDDPRYMETSDDVRLCESTDFGSYPSWAMSERQPVYYQLQLGPPPTNARSHLSLLSEAFHEVLNYKAPAVYKVPATTDPTFILEKISQIGSSLSTFLKSSEDCVTHEESIYFNLLNLLSGLITLSASLDRSIAEETLPDLVHSAEIALQSLSSLMDSSKETKVADGAVKLSNLHGLTVTRDSAHATRLACQWILSHNEREKERDRSGQSGLPKELVVHIKRLETVSGDVLKMGKSWVVDLHSYVGGVDLRKDVQSALLDGELQPLDTSITVDLMIQSWKMTLKGWQEVRWD